MATATWDDPTVLWSDPYVTWDGTRVVMFGADAVLGGSRVTQYRFDLLDADENLIGELENVEPGGSLSWDAYASVKGGGSLTVTDLGQGDVVDWLNVRIRPTVRLERVGGGDDPGGLETALGVFLCAAPVEDWSATGRVWTVELLDKLSILDQDIASGMVGGVAAYTAAAGANIVMLVQALIAETGEAHPAIQPADKVLAAPMVWEIGSTRLRIINDLLDAGGFFSLWCDGQGQYQVTPYVEPSRRGPVYESLQPFSYGGLMSPQWQRDRDIYSIPNRYVVVGQGDGETEALVAEATNTNPDSPYSYQARGRWITGVETGVEAATQADLDAIAKRRLSDATSVTTTIPVQHVYLPELLVNSVVRFSNSPAGLEILCSVTQTTVPLHPTELCSSQLRVVAI